jgi:hypothetical protein
VPNPCGFLSREASAAGMPTMISFENNSLRSEEEKPRVFGARWERTQGRRKRG